MPGIRGGVSAGGRGPLLDLMCSAPWAEAMDREPAHRAALLEELLGRLPAAADDDRRLCCFALFRELVMAGEPDRAVKVLGLAESPIRATIPGRQLGGDTRVHDDLCAASLLLSQSGRGDLAEPFLRRAADRLHRRSNAVTRLHGLELLRIATDDPLDPRVPDLLLSVSLDVAGMRVRDPDLLLALRRLAAARKLDRSAKLILEALWSWRAAQARFRSNAQEKAELEQESKEIEALWDGCEDTQSSCLGHV